MDTSKIRVIFEYEFQRRIDAAETARNVNAAFGEESANEETNVFGLITLNDFVMETSTGITIHVEDRSYRWVMLNWIRIKLDRNWRYGLTCPYQGFWFNGRIQGVNRGVQLQLDFLYVPIY